MLPFEIIDYWGQQAGIKQQASALSNMFTDVEIKLKYLQSLETADKLRSALAKTDEGDNSISAWYLLLLILENISTPQSQSSQLTVDQQLNLIEWELLISEYSSESRLLKAHGSFLKGQLLLNADRLQAREAYQTSNEYYSAISRPDLLSICLVCIANLNAQLDDITSAVSDYEKALALAPNRSSEDAKYRDLIKRSRDRSVGQNHLINQILGLESPLQWVSIVRQNENLIKDDDLIDKVKSRSRRFAVQKGYTDANRAAMLVDYLLAYRGDSPVFRQELASYYFYSNVFDQSEALLRVIIQEGLGNKEIELLLANSVCQQGRWDEGKRYLTKLVDSIPDFAQAHSLLGTIYLAEKQWDLAKRHLETALKLNPNDAMARQGLVSIPKASIKYDPGSKALYIGGDASGVQPDDMADAIIAALIQADPSQAEELLKSIKDEKLAQKIAARISVTPSGQKSHFDRAEQLFSQRKLDDAIAEYKLAIAEDPRNWQAYMGWGDTHYQKGEFQLAIVYFEESVALQPYAPTYRYLGDAYMNVGQIDKAIKAYQCAVETDPAYAPAKDSLRIAQSYQKGK